MELLPSNITLDSPEFRDFVKKIIYDMFSKNDLFIQTWLDARINALITTGITGIPDMAYGKAYNSGNQNVSDQTTTTVNLNATTYASGVTHENTDDYFTIVTAGTYMALGTIRYANVTQDRQFRLSIVSSTGGTLCENYLHSAVNNIPISVSTATIFEAAVGDQISLVTYHINGSTLTATEGADQTYLALFQIA